jgi:hypothetical protein
MKFNKVNKNKKFSGGKANKNPTAQSSEFEFYSDQFLSDVGNREIGQLIERKQVQRKPDVSEPGDHHELEADKTAERIVRSGPPDFNKMTPDEIIDHFRNVQMKTLNPLFENAGIYNPKDSGEPLDRDTLDYLQPGFGIDLDNVRVHKGEDANQLSKSVGAKAFAYGNNIVFAKNEYKPDTLQGKKLIAHELAHVEQQNSTGVQKEIIHRWPDETSKEPKEKARTQIGFKCHDAVVYWLLLSLKLTDKEALATLKQIHDKRGSSRDWVGEALGYDIGDRITSYDQANAGDILFTGFKSAAGHVIASSLAHSMVVIKKNKIRGYNNFGTFGTKKGPDKFSTEDLSLADYWGHVGTTTDMGLGIAGASPAYRVTYAQATSNLATWITNVKTEPDLALRAIGPIAPAVPVSTP